MVFAKTKVGAAAFSKQFQSRMVKKCYLAIVAGEIKGSGEIQDKLVVGDMRVSRVTSETEGEYLQLLLQRC